jgi:hypothetical protein
MPSKSVAWADSGLTVMPQTGSITLFDMDFKTDDEWL